MESEAIDVSRVERRLAELAEIGETEDGGVTRPAYSAEESEAIEYLINELPESYAVEIDSIGNVYASRDLSTRNRVFVGSHLDTVYNGGKYDGALGVIGGLEAIEAAYAMSDPLAITPVLTVFRAEESARFGQHTIGSRGALGMLTVEEFAATDSSDTPLWHAMQQQGFQPENLSEPTIDIDRILGFFEIHIEQGRVLDEAEETIGVVTSIRAPVRFTVAVEGKNDHSGATPMGLRRDAITAAAEMITTIETIGNQASEAGDLVATVGNIRAINGAINKVCGQVEYPLDIRSTDTAHRTAIEHEILEAIELIAAERAVSLTTEEISRSEPVELATDFIELLSDAAATVTADYRQLPSGGGHDAMNFQLNNIPTGMLFTPSIAGVSHNPEEAIPSASIHDSIHTLATALAAFDPAID